MGVDISSVLHVLAHELRTPAGIAQGYVRMLLEDRFSDAEDRRRALEQTQKALARVADLTDESSRLAAWFEREHRPADADVDLSELVERARTGAGIEPLPIVRSDIAPSHVSIPTFDAGALTAAFMTLIQANAKELRDEPCVIASRAHDEHAVDILIGAEKHLAAAAEGPEGPQAAPMDLERGGLGLRLVLAAVTLDAHGGSRWTVAGSRSTVGVRLPLEKRARP